MLLSAYRKIFPLSLRSYVYELFLGNVLFFSRNFSTIVNSKIAYYFPWLLPDTELVTAYRFFGKYGLTSYPQEHMLEYQNKDIQVLRDEQTGLPYVFHNGRKLFFRKTSSIETIQNDYRALLIEQDPRSAHRYVRSYDEVRNSVLLDIGSAEGIFSLDTIDGVDHVYLFECDDQWVAPLRATFAPWKDKVTIIQKYIAETTSESQVTIDDFLRDTPVRSLFLKMDIEGAEMRALQGAMETLRSTSVVQVAVTTYHRIGDPERIAELLSSLGFQYEFSEGLIFWDRKFSKGIIRGKK